MSRFFRALLLAALLFFAAVPVCAASADDESVVDEAALTEELLQESGADELVGFLPESVQKWLEQADLLPGGDGWDGLTPWGVLKLLVSGLGEGLSQPLTVCCCAVGIVLLYRLFAGFGEGGLADTRPVLNVVCVLCVSGILLTPCLLVMESTVDFLGQMGDFVGALAPVYAGLLAASGQAAAAVSWNTVLMGMVELMNLLSQTFFIPITGIFLALTIAGASGGSLNFSGVAAICKRVVLWALGLLLTVFVGVLTIRSFVSSAADGVSLRTGKYLAGSLLPLVGGAISDALGVLQGCLGTVLTGVGAFGMLALLLAFLPMMLQVGLMQLSLKLAQGAAVLLEVKPLDGLFEGAGFVLTVLQALLICCGMMLISALALLLCMGGQLWT